ncbi:MAG: Type II secretory pathway, pullulanase PulA and related glycosidase [Eubacterium sp.]|nr:Type II secretory pathway, pullulanase PulA and related glycosidase [Eubacterium sp.]
MKKGMESYPVRRGTPMRLGVFRNIRGVNFSLNVKGNEKVEVLLYHPGAAEPFQVVQMLDENKTGLVDAVHVALPRSLKFEYTYRIDGIEKADPFARVLRRHRSADGTEQVRCVIEPEFTTETQPLEILYKDTVCYKIHVKGFTKGDGSGVRHPGTFAGVREKIPYLKKMGITSLVLMPVYEFLETPVQPEVQVPAEHAGDEIVYSVLNTQTEAEPRKNYWGYTEGYYYALKDDYCATNDPIKEFGALVDALHDSGIECILEFFFEASVPGWMVINILHYWRMTFNLDGFHLVGYGDWITAVQNDPLLSWTKIFYVNYDRSRIYPYGKPLIRNLAEWNQDYQNGMRRFLKGDLASAGEARYFLTLNSGEVARLHYFADHDGMTLYDSVAYNEHHNEANGEDNRDGILDNHSWNCGVEGATGRRAVNQLRARQQRNAFLMLLTSQGTPMIYAGDEFCNSQAGNNNAWCQDNETGWLNWNRGKAARDLRAFVKDAIAFRMQHPVLRQHLPMRMVDYRSVGYPDLSCHGKMAWQIDDYEMKCAFALMYCGSYAKKDDGTSDEFIYLAYNMYWEPQEFALPDLPEGMKWKIAVNTAETDSFHPENWKEMPETGTDKCVSAPARSIVILISEPVSEEKKPESKREKVMAGKPADKTAGKEADKTSGRAADKMSDKAVTEAADKAVDETADKTADEASGKQGGRA